MPCYFMRDTPLRAMERMMMSQPGHKPRGGGMYRSPLYYTPKDVECEYCQNYVRKNPCLLCACTCLKGRIEAGVLNLSEFVRDCFAPFMEPQLQERMRQQFGDTYFEKTQWHNRSFDFSLSGITPEQNDRLVTPETTAQQTIVRLNDFMNPYRDSVPYSLESLAKKLIEHCLPYFITGSCPQIVLRDSLGESLDLNNYYEKTYKDSLHQDKIELDGKDYTLYHMFLTDGADKHELHLCANNREVKSYTLSAYIDCHRNTQHLIESVLKVG